MSRDAGGTVGACGAWRGGRQALAGEPEPAPHTSLLQLAGGASAPLGSCGKINIVMIMNLTPPLA